MAEKKINGVVYRFEPLVGWEAFDALDLLLDVVGPMAPMVAAAMDGRGLPEAEGAPAREDVMVANLAVAFAEAVAKRDRGAIRKLIELLISNCRADGEVCTIGVKPQSLDDMLAVASWAAERQFGSFFGGSGVAGLAKLLNLAGAKAP